MIKTHSYVQKPMPSVSNKSAPLSTQLTCPYCHRFKFDDEHLRYTKYDDTEEDCKVYVSFSLVDIAWGTAMMAQDEKGIIGLYAAGDNDGFHALNFCPICGRKLNND